MRELISLVDIAPTLLDACGIPIPEDMQGRSFFSRLNTFSEERQINRKFVFFCCFNCVLLI